MTLLRAHDLDISFGGNHAVNQVSFELLAGEMLAVIGPNGAGKSSLFNLIGGQLKADSGSLVFQDKNQVLREVLGAKPQQLWQYGIGRTFQIPATFASFTVIENVQMAFMSVHKQWFQFWSIAKYQHQEKALDLLAQVGLAAYAQTPCQQLSYSDNKRLELAIALAHQPSMLLMDEPTAGMPSIERQALMHLTKTLAKQKNIGVLFTEHSMDVVFDFADSIMVLARGQVIAIGSPSSIQNNSLVQEVYFGKKMSQQFQASTSRSTKPA